MNKPDNWYAIETQEVYHNQNVQEQLLLQEQLKFEIKKQVAQKMMRTSYQNILNYLRAREGGKGTGFKILTYDN